MGHPHGMNENKCECLCDTDECALWYDRRYKIVYQLVINVSSLFQYQMYTDFYEGSSQLNSRDSPLPVATKNHFIFTLCKIRLLHCFIAFLDLCTLQRVLVVCLSILISFANPIENEQAKQEEDSSLLGGVFEVLFHFQ